MMMVSNSVNRKLFGKEITFFFKQVFNYKHNTTNEEVRDQGIRALILDYISAKD